MRPDATQEGQGPQSLPVRRKLLFVLRHGCARQTDTFHDTLRAPLCCACVCHCGKEGRQRRFCSVFLRAEIRPSFRLLSVQICLVSWDGNQHWAAGCGASAKARKKITTQGSQDNTSAACTTCHDKFEVRELCVCNGRTRDRRYSHLKFLANEEFIPTWQPVSHR